ncbi:GGDEF domain-containing protein [Azospirillum thermophilum]|nr:GGDEF domain-containing protein [Azospirillum thermophilum]
MTGLHNRCFLAAIQPVLMGSPGLAGAPLTAVLLDLDLFKALTDAWERAVGDDVFGALARFRLAQVRPCDIPVRLGGEEMLVLLPGAAAGHAESCVDRWRAGFSVQSLKTLGKRLSVTFSVGAAAVPADAQDWNDLVHRADVALYQAKALGRCQTTSGTGPSAFSVQRECIYGQQ